MTVKLFDLHVSAFVCECWGLKRKLVVDSLVPELASRSDIALLPLAWYGQML